MRAPKMIYLQHRGFSIGQENGMLYFEWDENKAEENQIRHGVSFNEASTAFSDSLSLTIHDPLHSDEEDRFVLLGISVSNRLLLVVHTENVLTRSE